MITVGCPADMTGVTEPGQPYATLSWIIPQAEDYSPAKIKSDLIASPQKDPYNLLSSVSLDIFDPVTSEKAGVYLESCV